MPEPENPNAHLQLPSLEGLTNAEYLQRSAEFGSAWRSFVDDKDPTGPSPVGDLSPVLRERSAMLAAIPEAERAPRLIESYRAAANAELARHKAPPLPTEPLTPGLLESADIRVVEMRQGVPAILTNSNQHAVRAVLGIEANSSTGILNDVEGGLPFIILEDTQANHPDHFDLNRRHETAHTLWAIARRQEAVPEPNGTTENDREAFRRIQDEAIAFATAGQLGLWHTSNVKDLAKANMEEALAQYARINGRYRQATQTDKQLDPLAAVLGIMQARNLDELEAHINRICDAAAETPQPPPQAPLARVAIGGWSAA